MGYTGITPSLGVEIDTWTNGTASDPTSDHTAIISNGSINHSAGTNLAGPVSALSGGGNIEDCNYHDLHISWNPTTDSLKIYVDCDLRLSYEGDIVTNIFGGSSQVYWGFTGTTGALSNAQEFCIDYLSTGFTAEICELDSFPLSVGNGLSYSWSPGLGLSDSTSASPLAYPSTSTTYTATITDICGNTRQEVFEIDVTPLGIGGCNPLSARFGEADVKQTDNYRVDGWFETLSETGSEYFIISRSIDLDQWIPVDTISSEGGKQSLNTYSFSDPFAYEAGSDILYYQIVEFSESGSTYFPKKLQTAFNVDQLAARIFPNPAQSKLNIELSGELPFPTAFSIQLFNSIGQLVHSEKSENRSSTLSLRQLKAGRYHLVIRFQGQTKPILETIVKY